MIATQTAPRTEGLVWPQRQRCRKCRNYFGWTIVDGLFCSYECAGLPEPSRDPADWPRQHTVRYQGRAKRVFWVESEARDWLRDNNVKDKEPYRCDFCRQWHVGRIREEDDQ